MYALGSVAGTRTAEDETRGLCLMKETTRKQGGWIHKAIVGGSKCHEEMTVAS